MNTKKETRKAAFRLPTDALIRLGDYLHFDKSGPSSVETDGLYTEVKENFWSLGMSVKKAMEEYPRKTYCPRRKLLKVTRLVGVSVDVKAPERPAKRVASAQTVGAGPRGDLTIRFAITRKENAPWYLEINQGSHTIKVPYGVPDTMFSLVQTLKTKLGWAIEDFDNIVREDPDA